MNKTIIKTWLPVFPGFYETIFDDSDRMIEVELDDEESFRERYPELKSIPRLFIKNNFPDCVDFKKGQQGCVEYIIDHFPGWFNDRTGTEIIENCTFETINSPREYNYANDSVDVEFEIDTEELKRYIYKNEESFEEYLKDAYSSILGFISHYSNKLEDWIEITEFFTKLDGHYLGSILQFMVDMELGPDASEDLYYYSDCFEGYLNGVEIDAGKLVALWDTRGQ